MPVMHADLLFAPLDADLHLERVAGGNETEVYTTDDQRYVVKVKSEGAASLVDAQTKAKIMRQAADAFATAIGSEYSLPNYFLLSADENGAAQTLALQPYLRHARSLASVDYTDLSLAERCQVAEQLREIIRRSLHAYRQTRQMPDLYGQSARSKSERKRLNRPLMFLRRLWSFLVKRTLLHSHNLMLTEAPGQRIILIDYDPIPYGWLYQFVYYNVRRLLFLRDRVLIWAMTRGIYTSRGD